jgi:hypothetical protein
VKNRKGGLRGTAPSGKASIGADGQPLINPRRTVEQALGELMDATLRADGKWFEKHPQMNMYIRPMSADEIMLCWVAPGYVITGGVTRVTQIVPGVRERHQLRIDVAPIGRTA